MAFYLLSFCTSSSLQVSWASSCGDLLLPSCWLFSFLVPQSQQYIFTLDAVDRSVVASFKST